MTSQEQITLNMLFRADQFIKRETSLRDDMFLTAANSESEMIYMKREITIEMTFPCCLRADNS